MQAALPLIRPVWPSPFGVQAACSERIGGVSPDPYASLNLGDHVGDEGVNVARNRALYAEALAARPVFLKQVHGAGVVQLAAGTPDGTEADACWTSDRRVACTIMVADCLPVLLSDRDGTRVAAAHCGWRGLAGTNGRGVLEALVAAWGVPPARTLAWLGPCIGPQAFEVGPEVRAAFVDADPSLAGNFRVHEEHAGKFLADLPGLVRARLQALGVRDLHGNNGTDPWCTVANPSRFFSHRRDRVSGRFAASIWRD